MSGFTVEVYSRGNEIVRMPAGVTFSPESWDASAVGGALSALVVARGAAEQLIEIAGWIGHSLWIVAPDGVNVWQGDIADVRLHGGGDVAGVTLDGVANRIKVVYTDDAPGGDMESAETAWAEDLGSMARYGKRERMHTPKMAMRAAMAERLRDTLLEQVSRPQLVAGPSGGGDGESFAEIVCVGWWKRLESVYYNQDNGLVEHTSGDYSQPLGLGFTSSKVAGSSRDKTFKLHEIDGKLMGFAIPGLQVKVSGMGNGGNNKVYSVGNGDGKDPVTVGASNIEFEPADDIKETPPVYQLDGLDTGDVILISGASNGANNGSHLVKTPGAARIEISPGWSNDIVAEGAGNWIEIRRGNSIKVEEVVANERIGASATVLAYGQGIAQRFQTGTSAAWAVATVELKVRKVGNPTDDIEIRLVTDSGGSFGTWVATAFMDDAAISGDEAGRWVSGVFDVNYALSPGAWYWLGIQRVGAPDPENYYQVWLDEDAGFPGALLLSDGSSFHAPAEAKSLVFRLLGAVDTARQVEAICATVDAFDAIVVADESGLKTCQFRDGDLYASEVAGELLVAGDGSNVRLLAAVNALRMVTIRAQPARSTAQYALRQRRLFTRQGQPVTPGLLPVGEWCEMDNVILMQGALAGASPFFVERASYSPGTGWRLQPTGAPDPWMIGETRDG